MKNHIHILSWLLAAVLLAACQGTDSDGTLPQRNTYKLRLMASVSGYDARGTRSAYEWQQSDVVYLRFVQGNSAVTGTATYDASAGEWQLKTDATLTGAAEGTCQAAFIVGGTASGNVISLSQQARAYADGQASFTRNDDELTVHATLQPVVGRVRFSGSAGTSFTVSGLSLLSSYDRSSHTFTTVPGKVSATVGQDGYSPYYYAAFAADNRQLTFEISTTSGLRRTFGTDVLQAGSSGYITVPTAQNQDGWTLVSLSSGSEITFCTLSSVTVASVRSTTALLNATVSSVGNGTLSAAGFVLSTAHNPTLADSVRTVSGASTALSARFTGLLPHTTYYVRAFATNEAGTTYGSEAQFTTLSADDDKSSFDRDDFDSDTDYNDASGSTGNFDRDDWGNDEDWN